MSYFLYGSEDIKELVNAYEDYCDELVEGFYAQSNELSEAAWEKVKEVREKLGVPVDN